MTRASQIAEIAESDVHQHAQPGPRSREPHPAGPLLPETPPPAPSSPVPHDPSPEPQPRERSERQGRRLGWHRSELGGRLVELSAWGDGPALTLAFQLIAEAQHDGEPAAWITASSSTFYPPDAARCGIDLEALPVVRAPDAQSAARAADKLVRSGAFGLVVLDLATLGVKAEVPAPLQTRLLGLASKHDTAVVFLTEKQSEAPSLGSLVSLRAQAVRKRTAEERFSCEARVLKDKRRGPGWLHREVCHGPAGLR